MTGPVLCEWMPAGAAVVTPAGHHPVLEHDGSWRRWVCPCGWATPWTVYTNQTDGAQAVRHATQKVW